ncbi:OmpA family protein [Paenibacillus sp. JX-17]|uniref:OmpA family protein n=1 Tax=Paenibacillus lacisoli TaxID=3064525 RepID=A0ABT9CBH4_9BACL|nr:flagellar motor protein MotB [Paenibacillus sp. JX-17]MDO7906619.1 OmpA family protein [Paenibacillus sp. JX-17]
MTGPSRRRLRRRSGRTGEHGRDRWMITYADLITLLLIFFVLMHSVSKIDTDKYDLVTDSLQKTFMSGSSVLDQGSGVTGTGRSGSKQTANPQDNKTNGQNTLTEREQAFRTQEQSLQNLMKVIQQYVTDNKLGDQIFVSDKPQGISITLSDRFLFDPGQAALKSNSSPILSKLASLFRNLEMTVSIEGHTDNIPIGQNSQYRDNWELSGARALSVLRFFIDKEKLNPDGFQYAGYADTRPAADNSTPAGRQKNRRVEITVLRQLQGK